MSDITFSSSLKSPQSIEWGLRSNTLAFVSPLTGSVRTVGIPGARWVASLSWGGLTRAEADQLQAGLLLLRGLENRLLLWNLAKPSLRGAGGGSPVVNGGGQSGNQISISGLPVSTANVFRAGDMLGIGGELKMVSADASSNGSGIATVFFEPPLRASPANGSTIVTSKPTARFILNDGAIRWTHNPASIITGLAIDLTETFL